MSITMTKETLLSLNDGKYNSFPGMLFTRKKRLITAWRSGDVHVESIPSYIKGKYSDDMGKTWQPKDLLIDETIDARDIRFSQSTVTGRIFMTYQVSTVAPKIRYSDDNGDTWADLFDFSTVFTEGTHFGFGKLVEDFNGTLYYGIYDYSSPTKYVQKVVKSLDNGATWSTPFVVNDEAGKFNCELALTFVPNVLKANGENDGFLTKSSNGAGFLIGVMRPHSGFSFIVTSFDKGETWTKRDTGMNFAAHGADLIYSEGKLILTYRNGGGTPAVSVSDDLGYTWSDEIALSNMRGGYSQLAHIGGGVYGVTYYVDQGTMMADGEQASTFFRYLKIDEMPKISGLWRLLNAQSIAVSGSQLIARSLKVDRYKNLSLFLKSDAVHKKTIQVYWSYDGITTAFSENIVDETNAYLNVSITPKAPFILQMRVYNQDAAVARVYDFWMDLK